MCAPPQVVMASLAIGANAVQQYGQYRQAEALEDALNTQRAAQNDELEDRASQQAGDRVKAARAERARIRVAAGEAGVAGASFEAQLRDSFGQQNQDLALIDKNLKNADRASAARTASAFTQIKKPSLLSAGLQIAGAGYSGYGAGLDLGSLKNLSIGGGSGAG